MHRRVKLYSMNAMLRVLAYLVLPALLVGADAGPAKRSWGSPFGERRKGQYVVMLRPGKSAADFIRQYPNLTEQQVDSTYSTNQGEVIVANAPIPAAVDQVAANIATDPDVVIAEAAVPFQVGPSSQASETGAEPITTSWTASLSSMGIAVNSTEQWHLDRIDQPGRLLNGWYNVTGCGAGVNIYIVDTGINYNLPEFAGRASEFHPIGQAYDENGHGTFTAALAAGKTYGSAKCAKIYSVRVLDADGSGDQVSVGMGLAAVLNNRDKSKPSIVSMSLSGQGRSQLIDWFVSALFADNVLVVTAAGNTLNGNDSCLFSPGASASSLTVGATDTNDTVQPWANYGQCVNIYAPGRDVYSIDETGAEQAWSGTSMAAPIVAGAAALLWGQAPTLTSPQVFRAVLDNGVKDMLTMNPVAKAAKSPNLFVQARFNIAPAPTLGDAQALTGTRVAPCYFLCTAASDSNTASLVGGLVSATSSKTAIFRPQDNTDKAYTIQNLPAFTTAGNSYGLRVVNKKAYFQKNDGSSQPITAVVFLAKSSSIFFRDDGSGMTFYWSGTSLVALNSKQLLWLYSYVAGRFSLDSYGIYWWRGIEGYFDLARGRFWGPASIPTLYFGGGNYYFGPSPVYWLGGSYNIDRRRFATVSCGSWCGAFSSIALPWSATTQLRWWAGSLNSMFPTYPSEDAIETQRAFFYSASNTMFFDGTNLVTSGVSSGALTSYDKRGVAYLYSSLDEDGGIVDTIGVKPVRTFGATNTWSGSDSAFYATAADFVANATGVTSSSFAYDSYYGYQTSRFWCSVC